MKCLFKLNTFPIILVFCPKYKQLVFCLTTTLSDKLFATIVISLKMDNNSVNTKKFRFTESLGLKLSSISATNSKTSPNEVSNLTNTSVERSPKASVERSPKEVSNLTKSSTERSPKRMQNDLTKTTSSDCLTKPLANTSNTAEEEIVLKQSLVEINELIRREEETLNDETIELFASELILKENELKLMKEEKRREQLTEELNQLIKTFTQMESELNIKELEYELESNTVFVPKLKKMSEEKDYWQQLVDKSTEEVSVLQKEIKRLETEINEKTRLKTMADKAVLEIPDLRQMFKSLESQLQKVTEQNTALKNGNQVLSTDIDIENKRINAKIRRLRNEINRKSEEIAKKGGRLGQPSSK